MATRASITGMPTRAPVLLHLRRRLSAEIETHLQRVELLIARLDRLGGDCDVEANGDELDGTGSHEEDALHRGDRHAGDPYDAEPGAWPENDAGEQYVPAAIEDDDREEAAGEEQQRHAYRDRIRSTRCQPTGNPYRPFKIACAPLWPVVGGKA